MNYFCLSQFELAFLSLGVKGILKVIPKHRSAQQTWKPPKGALSVCELPGGSPVQQGAGCGLHMCTYVPTPTPACMHTCTVGAEQPCDSHVNPKAHVTGQSRRELCQLRQPLSFCPVHSAVNQSRRPAMPSPRG